MNNKSELDGLIRMLDRFVTMIETYVEQGSLKKTYAKLNTNEYIFQMESYNARYAIAQARYVDSSIPDLPYRMSELKVQLDRVQTAVKMAKHYYRKLAEFKLNYMYQED